MDSVYCLPCRDLFGNKQERNAHQGIEEVFYEPSKVKVPDFLPDTPECRAEIAQYHQSCSRIDQGLGHLVSLLKETGQWDNTVLIYTADHGMAFPGGKTTVYEAGLRVPFIVSTALHNHGPYCWNPRVPEHIVY